MAIDEKQQIKTWWTTTARQHHPQNAAELQQNMLANRNRLYDRFKLLPDGLALAKTLAALTEHEFAFAYYWGFRRGFKVAKGLAKLARSSSRGRAEARIADILFRHPKWTTRQIFGALDDEGIPLEFRGRVKDKKAKYWSDVATEHDYEQSVSRLRRKMARESRMQGWKEIMKQHTTLHNKEKKNSG